MHTFRDGTTDDASAEPLIRLRGVTKSYDTGSGPFAALRDVDLNVRGGVIATNLTTIARAVAERG